MKSLSAVPDFLTDACTHLAKAYPFAHDIWSSLSQPAELINIKPVKLPITSENLDEIKQVIADLQNLIGQILETDQKILKRVIQHYENYYQALLHASCDQKLIELLTPKVRLTGSHLENYLVSQEIAQELSWKDLYGFTVTKSNLAGTHHVLGRRGCHFKLSPAAHLEEGGLNDLHPGKEYAISSFYQLLDSRIAPPSMLLVLRDQELHQLPVQHPFTKGINQLFRERKLCNVEQFFKENPGVKKTLQDERIEVYKESRFLQASLTAGDIGLDTFLKEAHTKPSLWETVDIKAFSALFIASLLTNPGDGKPDNYRVQFNKDAEENILSSVIIAIDNDEALNETIIPLYFGGHTVGIKNVLYFLRPLMNKPINKSFIEVFLNRSPAEIFIEWTDHLFAENKRYSSLIKDNAITERSFKHLSLPIQFAPQQLIHLYKKLVRSHALMKNCSQHGREITHSHALKAIDPLIWDYYQALLELTPEKLLEIVAQKEKSALPAYQNLIREQLTEPLSLTLLLYGQGGLLDLSFEDLCDLNQRISYNSKTCSLQELLRESINHKRNSTEDEYLEDLEYSWQMLARETDIGAFLIKKATQTQDRLLAAKLIALGIGNIKDILTGIAKLDSAIVKLDLNNKSLTDTHAAELATALTQNCYLEELSLENNQITGQGLEHLLRAIRTQQKIKAINLKNNEKLSLEYIRTLDALSHIESLNLSQTSISDEEISFLASTNAFSSLKHLDISKNKQIKASAGTKLINLRTLQTLNLARTQAAEGIISGLAFHNKLTTLDLSHNNFTDQMVTMLVETLKQNKTLMSLNLYFNFITELSGESLAMLLQENQTLRFLNLGNNKLEGKGASRIARGLLSNRSLVELNLSRNNINEKGYLSLYKALQAPLPLKDINLSFNGPISRRVYQKFLNLQSTRTALEIHLKNLEKY